MADGVSVTAVADEIEACAAGARVFLNCRTGEFAGGTDDQFVAADGADDAGLTEPDRAVVARLREVLGSADWLELPPRRGSTDYRIMEEFCVDECPDPVRDELLDAIRGPGAFRRFRDEVRARGLQPRWEQFRRRAVEELAAAWLEEQAVVVRPAPPAPAGG